MIPDLLPLVQDFPNLSLIRDFLLNYKIKLNKDRLISLSRVISWVQALYKMRKTLLEKQDNILS